MPIRLGNSPVSWGIFEFEAIEKKYSYQQVLNQIAATGYSGLELGAWGFLPTDPAALRSELERRTLNLLSAYVPVKLVDAGAHEGAERIALMVGQLLAQLGAKAIVLADDNGTVPALIAQAGRVTDVRLSPDQWDVVAMGVNRIARRVHDDLGLKVVFHQHIAGYVETAAETRELMSRTDGDLVGLCLDTGHWTYAGGDALACVRAAVPRASTGLFPGNGSGHLLRTGPGHGGFSGRIRGDGTAWLRWLGSGRTGRDDRRP